MHSSIGRQSFPATRQRGTVLIVSLLMCAIIGISLASYLALSKNSLTLANRSFFNTSAINLAETGVEEAMWCFNQATSGVAVATAWSGWTISGNTAKRVFTDFTLSGGATARVRVLVENYNPSGSIQPKVYSDATVTLPNSSQTLTKMVEVDLRRRSRFAMGLVAKDQITFNGNTATVDSWNSLFNDDGTPRGSPVGYSAGVRHANGSVGSTSVAVGSIALNNADIFGFASVGSSTTTGINVGTQGIISGNFSASGGTVDMSRVATDFATNFDPVTVPAGGYIGSVGSTIGTTGTTSVFSCAGPINSDLEVRGHVTLIITPDTNGRAIDLAGNDDITLAAGATLTIYTSGHVDLRGNGVINPSSQASSLQIYGTGGTSQNIDIGGTADFLGVVYAPNANITIHGTPHVSGSIVGDNITVVGSAKFHYDEALANFGGNNPFGIVKWLELITPAQRTAAFATW